LSVLNNSSSSLFESEGGGQHHHGQPFMFESEDFVFVEIDGSLKIDGKEHHYKAFRLVHKETGKNFGEHFQAQCRSLECKAASIVHDKYRRKNDLGHEDLVSLCQFAESFAERRREAGKPINQDHLVQVVSAELKKRIAEKEFTASNVSTA
jgi:hypothetical protein